MLDVPDGVHEEDGLPTTVNLVLVPTEAGYVIVQGLVGSEKADAWLARFRAATASIRWTAP